MDCREVKEVRFLYVDREMEESLLGSFERHLEDCPCCANHIDYTQRFLSRLRLALVGCSAPSRLRQRILTSLPHRRV